MESTMTTAKSGTEGAVCSAQDVIEMRLDHLTRHGDLLDQAIGDIAAAFAELVAARAALRGVRDRCGWNYHTPANQAFARLRVALLKLKRAAAKSRKAARGLHY